MIVRRNMRCGMAQRLSDIAGAIAYSGGRAPRQCRAADDFALQQIAAGVYAHAGAIAETRRDQPRRHRQSRELLSASAARGDRRGRQRSGRAPLSRRHPRRHRQAYPICYQHARASRSRVRRRGVRGSWRQRSSATRTCRARWPRVDLSTSNGFAPSSATPRSTRCGIVHALPFWSTTRFRSILAGACWSSSLAAGAHRLRPHGLRSANADAVCGRSRVLRSSCR